MATIIHGVLLNIFDVGTLITGDPGMGKSETALALIARGHQLVADDAPEFKSGPIGLCPELLQGFLEVNNLGILNIEKIFGTNAIKSDVPLQLVINLSDDDNDFAEILGVKVPQININAANVRNCEILIETAVRNFSLQQQDYDANIDFFNKQKQLLQQEQT